MAPTHELPPISCYSLRVFPTRRRPTSAVLLPAWPRSCSCCIRNYSRRHLKLLRLLLRRRQQPVCLLVLVLLLPPPNIASPNSRLRLYAHAPITITITTPLLLLLPHYLFPPLLLAQ